MKHLKNITSMLMVVCMVLTLLPMSVFAEDAVAERKGVFTTETNTGKMNIVPYNNPDLLVDVGVGAWASSFVVDNNGDGYMDLIVSGNSKPYNGTYIFYGTAESQSDESEDYMVLEKGRYLKKGLNDVCSTYYYDENGNYEKTVLSTKLVIHGDATEFPFTAGNGNYGTDYAFINRNPFPSVNGDGKAPFVIDGNVFSSTNWEVNRLVDLNGDGYMDLVTDIASWEEYGGRKGSISYTRYTNDGVWGDENGDGVLDEGDAIGPGDLDENGEWDSDDDPIHGWILWTPGTADSDTTATRREWNYSKSYAAEKGLDIEVNDTEVLKVYEYTIGADGKKIPDMESGKVLDNYGAPCVQIYDWDNDGDLDLVCGGQLNDITYYENIGSKTNPIFAVGRSLKTVDGNATGELCQLNLTSFDWNQDGYMDLIVCEEDGRPALFQHTGTFTEDGTPIMKERRNFKAPADSVKVGVLNTPYSVDWDGDGDEDILCGDSAGFITFVKNLSVEEGRDLADPSWDAPYRMRNLKGEIYHIVAGYNGSPQGPTEEMWGYLSLSVADWDGDGTLDIMSNNSRGEVVWHRGIKDNPYHMEDPRPVEVEWQNGAKKPAWIWWNPVGNELLTQWRTTPLMIDLPLDEDLDGVAECDGLMDLVMVDHEGYLSLYRRYRDKDGTLKLKEPERLFKEYNNDFFFVAGTEGHSGRTKFCMVDYDMDGDLDIIRNGGINVMYFENVATKAGAYNFVSRGSVGARDIADHETTPTVCDWDQNGIPDLLIGAMDGNLYYQKNTVVELPETVDFGPQSNYLTAFWDFEGEEPYADKAPAGTNADTLTVSGTTNLATVEDGIAKLASGAVGETVVLTANNSADINPIGEMTIFVRAKLDAPASGTVYGALFDKYGSYGFINGMNSSAHSVDMYFTYNSSNGRTWTGRGVNSGAAAGQWREYAIVISQDTTAGTITGTTYVSKAEDTESGSDFVVMGETKTVEGSLGNLSNALRIGNSLSNEIGTGNAGYNRYFDEFRIYNKALTTEELSQLVKAKPRNPEDYLRTHWDFEGIGDEVYADKATNGSNSDSLYVISAASEVSNSRTSHTTNPENYVTVADGVATLKSDGSIASGLMAAHSSDINPTGEMTVFLRAKMENDPAVTNCYAALYHKYRNYAFYNHKYATGYRVQPEVYLSNALKPSDYVTLDQPVDEWREYVMVVSRDIDAGTITATAYVSNKEDTDSSADYVRISSSTTTSTDSIASGAALVIGNSFGMENKHYDRYLDDFRIYNTALTLDEIAGILKKSDKPEDNLVAHWDFEGDDVYADKATAGTVADNVVANGTVIVADGVATVTGAGYLEAPDSADLDQTGKMTIFAKVYVEGNGNAGLVDKRESATSAAGRTYGVFVQNGTTLGAGLTDDISTEGHLDNGVWREVALVIDHDENGWLNYELFVSKNESTATADDFVSMHKKRMDITTLSPNDFSLLIGNDRRFADSTLTRKFDDVRIYSKALTLDELAELLPAAGDTTSYYLSALETDLKLSNGGFTPGQHTYSSNVGKGVETIKLLPVAEDKSVVVKINGSPVNEGGIYAVNPGSNRFDITLGDGTSIHRTYIIVIERAVADVVEPDDADDLDNYLTAYWDFEGTGDEVFADKATKDSINDTLTVEGKGVTVADGVATIGRGWNGALKAEHSAELNPTTGMTILFKAMLDKESATFVAGDRAVPLVSKLDNDGVRPAYSVEVYGTYQTPAVRGKFYAPNHVAISGTDAAATNPLENGVWREYAFVVDKGTTGMVGKLYASRGECATEASDWILVGTTAESIDPAIFNATDTPFRIGNDGDGKTNGVLADRPLKRSFEEVRIYNIPLTLEQMTEVNLGDGTVEITLEKLRAAIDMAKEIEQGDYTDASFTLLAIAIEEAQEVADDADATTEARTQAYDALKSAIKSLTTEYSARADLQAFYARVMNTTDGGYTYWSDFSDGLSLAASVLQLSAPSTREIEVAYDTLRGAYKNLYQIGYDAQTNRAKVLVPESGSYLVIFVDYHYGPLNTTGVNNLEAVDVQATANQEVGVTMTKPFSLQAGSKVMLWSDLTNIEPICAPFVVE